MQEWLLGTWYGASQRGWWLLPLGWLFAGLSTLRRWAYRRGVFRSYRSPRPVVIVGNLSVGGTGKTPLVIWLAGELAKRRLRIGIASRGYGGRGGQAKLVGDSDDAASVGDEAVLLHRRLRLPVAIAANRAEAVRLLEPMSDVILADDGLQHYALQRDLEIAVVDGERGLGNGRLLPAGPLREPRARLDEVDAVVVNGAGFQWPGALRMNLVPVAVVALVSGERRAVAAFAGKRVHAIAAIGNPARFFSMLREQGLRLDELPLPDHAAIPRAALRHDDGQDILMTEKDAVKCPDGGLPHAWYVEVDARIDSPQAGALLDRIVEMTQRNLGARTGG